MKFNKIDNKIINILVMQLDLTLKDPFWASYISWQFEQNFKELLKEVSDSLV